MLGDQGALMTLIISRLVLTLIFCYLIFLVWTKEVDIFSWLHKKAENILPIAAPQSQKLLFNLSAEFGLDPVEVKEYKDEEPKVWRKARLMFRFSALAITTRWSENTVLGIVFYSADRLHKTESDLPKWVFKDINFGEKPPHHRVLHHTVGLRQINSASPTITKWTNAYLSVDHSPWKAAVYLLEENEQPQWFQLTIEKGNPMLEPKPGQGVQVRNHKLSRVTHPMVSAGYEKLVVE